MLTAPPPEDDARVAALHIADLLDAPVDHDLVDLVGLAAQLCQTPHAAISVLDAAWEWEPSGGRFVRIRSRSDALGAWITTHRGPLVVADIRTDPLFQATALRPNVPAFCFYAGVPLIQRGVALGTLYVTDAAPRSMTDQQVAALVTLSRQIMMHLEGGLSRAILTAAGSNAVPVPGSMIDRPRERLDHPHERRVLTHVQNLYDLGQQLLHAPSLEVMAACAIQHITTMIPCSFLRISAHDLDTTSMRTLANAQPNRLATAAIHAGPATVPLEIPLMGADGQIGMLTLESAQQDGFSRMDVAIAQISATVLAVAIDHFQLVCRMQASRDRLTVVSRRLIAVQEDERRHLARELHDEIGQALTAIRINLHHVYGALPAPQDKAYVQDSLAIVHQLVQQVRTLSLDLRPSMLDDLGLISAVRWYLVRQAHRSGLPIHFMAGDDPIELDSTIATACFRIVQESLTNILRHAAASSVTVRLGIEGDAVAVSIEDDGCGFDPTIMQTLGESLGLLGMQERAVLAGGVCTIQTIAGHGTHVQARFSLGQRSSTAVERSAPMDDAGGD